jgi:hypothetical protein
MATHSASPSPKAVQIGAPVFPGQYLGLFWNALVAVGVAVSLFGCASNGGAPSAQVRLGPGDIVRLVPQERGSPPNHHPAHLDAEQLRFALGALRMRVDQSPLLGDMSDGNDDGVIQVFTDEDLKRAAVALERAFAEATPQQDVALRLSQLRGGDMAGFLRSSRVTAARLFHFDGKLNIIFGVLDQDQERELATKGGANPKTSSHSGVDGSLRFGAEMGSRNLPRPIEWNPLLPMGARLHSDFRTDWVELDPDVVAAAARTSSTNPSSVQPTPTPQEVAPQSLTDSDHTEQKLRQLRSYYEEGLIGEGLYREKVRELLERHLESPAQ